MTMDCHAVDELAGAYALGAVSADEARSVTEHLDTCREPHAELRALIGADRAMAMSLAPVPPSAVLRDRLMTSVAGAPQEHRPVAASVRRLEERSSGGFGWLSAPILRPIAVAAMVAVVAVGAWNVNLQAELSRRDRTLRFVAQAIAGAETAFRVDGSAGRGYLVTAANGDASLLVADLADLAADQLYELWLIDASGSPVAVGTFLPTSAEVAVISIERRLAGYTTFAVTIEQERVEAPTGTPVMIGDLLPS